MSTPQVAFFKKGKSRPTTTRKRSASPPPTASTSAKSQVILPNKKAATNLLSAGTKRKISDRERDEQEDTRDGPDVKWSSSASHQQAALDILAGDELDALEEKKRLKLMIDSGKDDEDTNVPDDGQYHGQSAYRTHLKKNKEVPKAMRVGPQRNTSTIRTVTVVDYQPDVCKDYKETGFCGFGDTCKFLHDRGTYLAGWQLDKIAENPKAQVGDDSDSDSDDEDIPFACLICREHYTDPIVTRCGHYFCSACAIKRFKKTPKCAACGAPTGGMFNRADKVIAKVEKKRKDKEDEEEGASGDEGGGGGVQIEGLGEVKGRVASESDSESDSDDE